MLLRADVEIGSSYASDSAHIRESKKVLDSGLHARDFGLQLLDFEFFVSGTWRVPGSKF